MAILNCNPIHNPKKQTRTTSSLLIPNYLLEFFSARSASFRGTKHYFQYLMITYARHLEHYKPSPISNQWKKEYQIKGLGLQQKNFKPDPLLWEEFRNIASVYSLAMCKLFTVLLELEYSRWIEAGCPDNFREIPPSKAKTNKFGMNSNLLIGQKIELSLERLVYRKNSTILIRIVDFSNSRVDRFCQVRPN